MDRSRWLLVAALALAVLGVWGLVISRLADPGAAAVPSAMASPLPARSATVAPTAGTASPIAGPTPVATAEPTATPSPAPTASPTEAGAGDPRLRYIEFQLRLADAADDVEPLNESLTDAARAEDDAATVTAAVDMLDFVDRERDWLAQHPPADCYADAHRAARVMLRDYGAVADGAIDYANATGLDRLEAFGEVLERADAAGEALRGLGDALEAATCLG